MKKCEEWIRKTIAGDFRWKIRPQDNASNRQMVADLVKDAIRRNDGTFPEKNSFIEREGYRRIVNMLWLVVNRQNARSQPCCQRSRILDGNSMKPEMCTDALSVPLGCSAIQVVGLKCLDSHIQLLGKIRERGPGNFLFISRKSAVELKELEHGGERQSTL